MKVGILTFPNSISYGASLQMCALYRTVGKLGHDAEIINYHNAYMKAEKHLTAHGTKRSLRSRIRYLAKFILHRRLEKTFRAFEKKNMVIYPSKPIVEKDKLLPLGARYEAVVCGSDQIWNPNIMDSDMSYFLSFCGDETKRISYAPSFGVERISDTFAAAAGNELQQFTAISVREVAGRELVKQITKQDVQIVADPTMLVEKQEWMAMESAHPMGKGDYILYYTVKSSPTLLAYCKSLSHKTGLKIVIVGGNAVKKLTNRDPMLTYAVDVSPEEWLYLLHHARYVVTNSFHGTAFSIIYRKDFYVEFSSDTNSRLMNITEIFGLTDRVVKDCVCDCISDCDYTETDKKMPILRGESLQFLQDALSENKHG